MRRLRTPLVSLPIVLAASTAFALPRPNSTVPSGANHHVGDASFVAKHGRTPTAKDTERERMHAHLAYIRDWLASRPATRPDLEAKRKAIIGFLSDYVDKDITPANAHVPWRTPVFIDDQGQICAVGYLIEQSVGRALPEKIAKQHRYDFIEDIAADMPEVAAWVAESGLTLDEIGSIQPAYEEPRVNTWQTWNLAKYKPADGPYHKFGTGTFKRGQMEGAWTVGEVGHGTMKHGGGTWTSFYPDGKKLAVGPYVANRAHGDWKIFYASGRVAAEGAFRRGERFGLWHFWADDAAKTPIASGKFAADGRVVGTWKHFDASGTLVAVSKTETPDQWLMVDSDWRVDGGEGFRLDMIAKPGEVVHSVHQGTVGSTPQALDAFTLGSERLYDHKTEFEPEIMYDAEGWKLEHTDAGWRASNCHWTGARKQAAHAGDLVRLHGLLYNAARLRAHVSGHDMGWNEDMDHTGPKCDAATEVTAERAARLDTILASRTKAHAISPQAVRAAVLANEADPDRGDPNDDDAPTPNDKSKDLDAILTDSMRMYIEWPHIDGQFVALFATMPGRFTHDWAGGNPEEDPDGRD